MIVEWLLVVDHVGVRIVVLTEISMTRRLAYDWARPVDTRPNNPTVLDGAMNTFNRTANVAHGGPAAHKIILCLLGGGSPCKLCCLRCDQFELVEGQTSLSLRERPFVGGELRLLIGLIKHNPFIEELDLSATDLESDAANLSSPGTYEMQQLSAILGAHPSLRELKMEYNPAIDQATREKLRSAAAKEESPINLLL